MTYTITFYVPVEACDTVKQAMFAAGAGALGNYDQCSWQVLGQGQFRALAGSQPAIGEQDTLSHVDEFRVEMLCAKQCLDAVVMAMLAAHPYEEVAYHVNENILINTPSD